METIAGVTTLFVPTSKSGAGGLVRYKISGTTATKVGSYRFVSTSGSVVGGGALRVIHYDDTNITFLFKSGKYCMRGTLPISQTSGDIVLTNWCTLDYSSCYVNGVYKVYVAAVYKDSDGTVWTSGVLGYSIGAYCASQASKGGDIANLAMATAVYGYHAKQYFG